MPNISKWTQLRILHLSENQISFISEGIGNCQALLYLYIQCNQIEEITPALGNCKRLLKVDLSENKELKELPSLKGCPSLAGGDGVILTGTMVNVTEYWIRETGKDF